MRLILDTHIFLWSLAAPEKLNDRRRQIIESRTNTVFVSAVSFAELSIKASIGKMNLAYDLVEHATLIGFDLLPLQAEEAACLKDLPFHHRDPFDRMLIAQSMLRSYPIMTDDEKFRAYECEVI